MRSGGSCEGGRHRARQTRTIAYQRAVPAAPDDARLPGASADPRAGAANTRSAITTRSHALRKARKHVENVCARAADARTQAGTARADLSLLLGQLLPALFFEPRLALSANGRQNGTISYRGNASQSTSAQRNYRSMCRTALASARSQTQRARGAHGQQASTPASPARPARACDPPPASVAVAAVAATRADIRGCEKDRGARTSTKCHSGHGQRRHAAVDKGETATGHSARTSCSWRSASCRFCCSS